MRKVFSPRSRAQDERMNTLQQNDFAYGVYNDLPSNEIPTRGVARLVNYTNKSSYLESRTGTKVWGDSISDPDNPVPAASIPTAVSDVTGTIDKLEPFTLTYVFQESDLDSIPTSVNFNGWFVSREENGELFNDKVIHFSRVNNVVELQVATRIDLEVTAGPVVASVSGPVYGLYYSRFHNRVIMHVGCAIYVSTNQYMTEWTKAQFIGDPKSGFLQGCPVNDSRSTITEYDSRIVILNGNGVFVLNCDILPAYYFKSNSDVPTERLNDTGADSTNPELPSNGTDTFGRKRVYSFGRLTGEGYRNRKTPGVKIEWESGGVLVEGLDERDYSVEWRADEDAMISASDNIRGLTIDGNSKKHATHFFVYATRNIDIATGIEALGNNTEELIWEMDIPIADIFEIEVTGEPVSGEFTFTTPGIDSMWKGTTAVIGSTGYTIATVTAGGGTITGGAGSLTPGSYTMTIALDSSETGTVSNGTTVTVADSSLYSVGKKLYATGGVIRYVDSIVDATTITIDKKLSDGPVAFGVSTTQIDIDSVNSEVRDYELTIRAESSYMLSRFWTPVVDSNLGTILPGFIMYGVSGNQTVQYTQLSSGFEYLIGQYNAIYQFTKFDDSVRDITGFDGNFAVKCNTSTQSVNSTSYVSSGNPDVGRFVFVLSTVTTVSDNIGVVGPWASVKIDGSTDEWVLTSRMELRKFNGREYGANVMSRRYMNRLRNMSGEFTVGHHPYFGLVIFGVA